MKRIIIALFVVLVLTSCVSTNSSVSSYSQGSSKRKEVSFKDEEGSLLITNTTSSDVVVFVGSIRKNIVLGGIRSNEKRSFNLAKLPDIPKMGSLLVKIVSYTVYKEKLIITKEDVVYQALVVYDLNEPTHKSELYIPKEIDINQKYGIVLTNKSDNFVLEVRVRSPTGNVVATLLPSERNKPIFLLPQRSYMLYSLFPIFIYVNPKTGEVTTIPTSMENVMIIQPQLIEEGSMLVEFDVPQDDKIPCNTAFINLHNNTSQGVEFLNKKKVLANQKGIKFTRPWSFDVYELPIEDSVGGVYSGLLFKFGNIFELPLTSHKFKPGYEYNITLSEIGDEYSKKYEYKIRDVGRKNFVEDVRMKLYMEEEF